MKYEFDWFWLILIDCAFGSFVGSKITHAIKRYFVFKVDNVSDALQALCNKDNDTVGYGGSGSRSEIMGSLNVST